MQRCAHCGSKRLYPSGTGSGFLHCRDCPGTTIADTPEARLAAARFRDWMANGRNATMADSGGHGPTAPIPGGRDDR